MKSKDLELSSPPLPAGIHLANLMTVFLAYASGMSSDILSGILYGGFLEWGYLKMDGLYKGKSHFNG